MRPLETRRVFRILKPLSRVLLSARRRQPVAPARRWHASPARSPQLISRAVERLAEAMGSRTWPVTLTSGGAMPRHRNSSVPCIARRALRMLDREKLVEAVENLHANSSASPSSSGIDRLGLLASPSRILLQQPNQAPLVYYAQGRPS